MLYSVWELTSGTGQRVDTSNGSMDDSADMLSALGNGWAAAGMLRVLGTIKNSQYAKSMKNEQTDLANWVIEIQDGMYGVLVSFSTSFPIRVTSLIYWI